MSYKLYIDTNDGFLQQTEFDSILQERATVSKLNSLDALLEEARKRKARAGSEAPNGRAPVPPHTLAPETIYGAHLAPFLQQQYSQLNAMIQTTQGQNSKLIEDLDIQHQEIEQLVGRLEGVVQDLESAGKVLGEGRESRIGDVEKMELDGR